MKENMISSIFLSCVIILVSEISIVIGLTRYDTNDPDILAHVILFDLSRQ